MKRYYWLRLHDDFFDSLRIKKLRKLAGGDTYTIIYLKMQLQAIHSDGILRYTGVENDFAAELALDLDENVDDVRVTLQYLMTCGLCECSDNINFFLPYAIANTGSEDASAQRVRDYRQRQKALQCNTDVTSMKRTCNVEIEKEIDTRDIIKSQSVIKEKIKNINNNKNKIDRQTDYPYLNLSDEQIASLERAFPDTAKGRMLYLNEYIQRTGKRYSDHYALLLNDLKKVDLQTQKRSSFVSDVESHKYTDEDYNNMFDNFGG